MNLAETRYKAALQLYNDQKKLYDTAYAPYEPFINGITAARTKFSNDFIDGLRIAEAAWDILNVSKDNPSVVVAPTNPSISQLTGSKLAVDGRKRTYWLEQLDYYSCSN